MERTLNSQLSDKIASKVLVKGWLHNFRLLGKLGFAMLRDRTGLVQVVVDEAKVLDELKALQPGSVLEVEAEVAATDKTELGVELIKPAVKIVNAVTHPWPVEINKPELKANLDTVLENRALTLRHQRNIAIFKIQGEMARAYREYMANQGFTEFFGPAMTASSSEGGAEIFKFDYFGGEATLAQSNQLYKQMMVGVYEGVFAMQKWFRAENSNTRRHLTEGLQYEFELGFIDSIDDVLLHLEGAVSHMINSVAMNCAKELAVLGNNLVKLPEPGKRFPRLKFSETAEILAKRMGEDTSTWDDMSTEAERELCAYAREEYGTDFIIVTNYPKGKFYAYRDETGMIHNFDLLCRDAEIVSGGRRVDNYDKLVAAIKAEGMNPDAFSEYLSIFKYGMPPHGGFGLGFERFTMLALGLDNIREASMFPSDTKRVASQQIQLKKVFGPGAIKRAIKQLFVESGVDFQVLTHEPTPTSEDAAKVRGFELGTGVKALILRNKKTGANLMVAIPADKKLNIKAVEAKYAVKNPGAKLEFEKPETITERYGLVIGGVPPFGHVFGVETYADKSILDTEVAAFNNAEQTESLLTTSKAIEQTLVAEWGEFIS
jgi:nondiscriminating aspartyl-tRNA synthetase